MTGKISRQAKIKEIIATQKIGSQEELLEKLRALGFDTTQATLSRDLHEIGIIRVPDGRGFKYVFHQENNSQALRQVIGVEIVSVINNESTVVVKTMPGRAQGVAVYFDKIEDSHIIGTVAGDDAIIVIPDAHQNVPIVVEKIKDLME